MEAELTNLISSWKSCFDSISTHSKSASVHQNAISYIENFKQNSPFLLDIGIYLATQQHESCEMAHFGLQLIFHAIKFKWNGFSDDIKNQLKSKMLMTISGIDNTSGNNLYFNGPTYLKNSLSQILIELLKREWPQHWPNFLDELFSISNSDLSIEAKKIVFIVLKFISEEFIIEMDTSLPTQRRKDIVQCLNLNMEKITNFYLNNLQFLFNQIQSPTNQIDVTIIIELTKLTLDSFNYYLNWINFKNLFSRNFLLVNILLSFLNHEKLYIESANCLISIISRKGSIDDRKPLLLFFDEMFLQQILSSIKKSFENVAFKNSLKFLVKILVGIGHQLSAIWNNDKFTEKPIQLTSYLKSIIELVLCPNKIYSNEAVQLWCTFLSNEFIKKDEAIRQLLPDIATMFTSTNVLFKINSSEVIQDLDSEEDNHKFFQKYRSDLAKLLTLASSVYLEPFFMSSHEWSLKILRETSDLNGNDSESGHQTGFDSNSFLYLSWDALVFFWNNFIQVILKKMRQNENADLTIQLKMNLMFLIDTSIKFKSKNPNFTSFNLSFLSAILQSCEFCDSNERENVLKLVMEKLFDELTYFKNESIQMQESTKSVNLKCYMNVRRQIAANILNACKNYTKDLKSILNPIYEQVNKHMELISATQMEKIILTQALIHCSNQLPTYEHKIQFISELIKPSFTYLVSEDFQGKTSDPKSFVSFTGLNDVPLGSSDECLNNRKQIFYHVNILFAILKSLDLSINSDGNDMLEKNFLTYLFKIFEVLIDLLKCFNMLHSLSSTEIKAIYLSIPESAKISILGSNPQQQQCHASNLDNAYSSEEVTNSQEKCQMFFYNTYETLNQMTGLFLNKFKKELLLTEIDQEKLNFIYKLGESIFCNFNQLPNFRIRLIIRYILKSCLIDTYDKSMFERNFIVIKINEVFLEFFLPSILARIKEANKYYASLKEKEDDDEGNIFNGKNASQLSENTINQIIEENVFSVMCRDVVDLIRQIFNFKSLALLNSKNQVEEIDNDGWSNLMSHQSFDNKLKDETNFVTSSSGGSSTNVSGFVISELIVHLFKTNKVIYQSIILCIFEGLSWPDSFCCTRLVRICLSLLDCSSFNEDVNLATTKPINLLLNEQATEQVFLCCMFALQTHGEDLEIANLIINLAYQIYQKFEIKYKHVFQKIISQIPNLNTKLFDDFINKYLNNMNNVKEKEKKEVFKKLMQPIVGKQSNQFQKNEISIRVLPAYNLVTEKKKAKFNLEKVNEVLDYNICSLFDSC